MRGRGRGRAGVALSTLVVTLAIAGCGNHSAAPTHRDGGPDAATMFDAHDAGADQRDTAAEAPSPDVACRGDAGTKKAAGGACECASDCASNFCVDGVCCGTACTEAC